MLLDTSSTVARGTLAGYFQNPIDTKRFAHLSQIASYVAKHNSSKTENTAIRIGFKSAEVYTLPTSRVPQHEHRSAGADPSKPLPTI